jgi:hypothetical protein
MSNSLTYYHYTYLILFETGHKYFGLRTSKVKPELDTGYVGSPKTHKKYWDSYKFSKTILMTFSDRESAAQHEIDLIAFQWNENKEVSLNVGMPSSLDWCKASGNEFSAKDFTLYHEDKGVVKGKNVAKFAESIGGCSRSLLYVIEGKSLTHRGYFRSEETYKLWRDKYYFTLYHPEKGLIDGTNLSEFAEDNNCHRRSLSRVAKGERLRYKMYFRSEEDYLNFIDPEIPESKSIRAKGVRQYGTRWLAYHGRSTKEYFSSEEQAIEARALMITGKWNEHERKRIKQSA